jgi:5-methylcytosine-specific restriction protein A
MGIKYNSWELLNNNIALKTVDRSVLIHNSSGVPIGMRDFFNIKLEPGNSETIKFEHYNKTYDVNYQMDRFINPRTKINWRADFRDFIRLKLNKYYKGINENKNNKSTRMPKIRLEKQGEKIYSIQFIIPEEIHKDNLNEEFSEDNTDFVREDNKEGRQTYYYSKKYERNYSNRLEAIEYHGTKCMICGFDFERVYGERGIGFIEIHHINPLSNLEEETLINPKKDLIPVCANCHRIIHREKNNVLTIEDMKKLLDSNNT